MRSDVIGHNLNLLVELDRGHSLGIQGDRLTLSRGSDAQNRSFSLFEAFFGSSQINHTEIARVVNKTCRCFVNTVGLKYFPIRCDSPALHQDRVQAKDLLKTIDAYDSSLLTQKTRERMNELIEMPEVLEARMAMKVGIAPTPLNQTTSGTYILRDRLKRNLAIFKPKLQEFGGPKNPSWLIWLSGASSNPIGIEPGTSYLRERAAYLLDQDHFAAVPKTRVATIAHRALDTSLFPASKPPKQTGSFQLFVNHCKLAKDAIPAHEFINKGELENPIIAIFTQIYRAIMRFIYWLRGIKEPGRIHPMAILDIVTLNSDRHFANFLVDREGNFHPIDHGLILPSNAARLRLEWKHLKQSNTPFTDEELEYIRRLDPYKNEQILRNSGIDDEAVIARMKLSLQALKICAEKGFTPHQIAMLLTYPIEGSNAFERRICDPILSHGRNAKQVIENLAHDYLTYNRVR
jgi:hypothetical protein